MSPKKEDTSSISVVHPICCGLDVHKDTICACVLWSDAEGRERQEVAEFGTFTTHLVNLKEWLFAHECPIVAMESTGQYWTPVHNVLEHHFRVLLVNPKHMKNVPGRKTDASDSKWIASLLRHGLLKGGFIPPKFQRQWRDLTRTRKSYVRNLGDFKRRIHKLFQCANIKIDSVVSNLFGLTGRGLMKMLVENAGPLSLPQVEQCLMGKLKNKATELHEALQGFFDHHHRYLLSVLLQSIEHLEDQIHRLDDAIHKAMADHQDLMEQLKEIPGISDVAAASVLSEIGPTLEAFQSPAALASWCGICPGNNQSAGKRRSGKNRVRKNHLKEIMVEIAWPAVKKKGSYFKSKYYALKARLGPKKAIVAVAHRILVAIYHVIKYRQPFKDLGEHYLLDRNRNTRIKYLKKQATLLGYELVPKEPIFPVS
jgi:transposase